MLYLAEEALKMFGLAKKQSTKDALNQGIDRVAAQLKHMGYDITPAGRAIAERLLAQGRPEVALAGDMAVVTMAQDVKAAGSDIQKLMGFMPHGIALLEVYKSYRDDGNLTHEVWKLLSTAVYHLTNVDEQQEVWIEGILRTPLNSGQRVAMSRIPAPDFYDNKEDKE